MGLVASPAIDQPANDDTRPKSSTTRPHTPTPQELQPASPLTPSRIACGRRPHAAELTRDQRIQVRTLRHVGLSYNKINEALGVTQPDSTRSDRAT